MVSIQNQSAIKIMNKRKVYVVHSWMRDIDYHIESKVHKAFFNKDVAVGYINENSTILLEKIKNSYSSNTKINMEVSENHIRYTEDIYTCGELIINEFDVPIRKDLAEYYVILTEQLEFYGVETKVISVGQLTEIEAYKFFAKHIRKEESKNQLIDYIVNGNSEYDKTITKDSAKFSCNWDEFDHYYSRLINMGIIR